MSTMPTNTAAVETELGVAMEVGGTHSGREARNLAEKHRRDKLNASIQELATMVPHVADSSRRLDKTAVLRFAAHGLRLQHVFGKSVPKKRLCGIDDHRNHMAALHDEPQITDTLMQLLDTFFITLTCHGQIVVISASVEQLLGHCQSDLYGQNLLHITHPDDQALLLQQLIPRDMEALFRSSGSDYQLHREASVNDDDDVMDSDGSTDDYYHHHHHHHHHQQQEQQELNHRSPMRSNSPQTDAHLADIDRRLRADRRSFTVRLARAGTRSEAARTYELVKIDGCFRRSDFSCSAGTFPIVSQLIRRTRSNGAHGINGLHMMQHDVIAQAALHGISGNDIVLVAMARIMRPPKIINRLMDGGQLEYRTRHLIDGRIIDCDQRIGLVAGYMKDEVRNLSPFSFMHQDDVRWVIVALRQMYDCNSDYGESCYRLLSRNGHFIYLQTKGYLEIDKKTNKVHSFVCVNTLLDEEEGRRRVQQMKDKFSVIIKTKIPSNSLQDVPASQNPQQLERIVLYLIENLQKRHDNGTATGCGEAAYTQADNVRYAKTPPLALVPPEPASVKSSISQSVTVVNVTAARNLQQHLSNLKSPKSVNSSSEVSLSPASSIDTGDEISGSEHVASPSSSHSSSLASHRPNVLQMKSLPTTPTTIVNAPMSVLEQRLTLNTATIAHAANDSNSSVFMPSTEALQQQISVLKRLRVVPISVNDNGTEESVSPAKRYSTASAGTLPEDLEPATASSTEIHAVISSSLDNMDQSLGNILQNARSLSQQHASLISPVPRAINRKLNAIFVEQQKQAELLVNIKNEYNVHILQQQQQQQQQQQPLYQQQQQQQQKSPQLSVQPILASYATSAVVGQHGKRL